MEKTVNRSHQINMNILIVEDNVSKLDVITRYLGEIGNLEFEVALCASAARGMLTKKYFSLVMLDIVLPNFPGGEPSPQTGLDLLREIEDSDYLVKPGYIVGVTGFRGVAEETRSEFESRLWGVVVFEEAESVWRANLKRLIDHIKNAEENAARVASGADLCIVTALKDPELRAVLNLPWNWQEPEPLDHQTFIHRGSFDANGRLHQVVAAHAPRMGAVATALLTAQLIQKFHPKLMAMVGICAGLRGKVNLRDVIAASVTWDWQSGKIVSNEGGGRLQIEPDYIQFDGAIKSKLDLIDDAIKRDIFRGDLTGYRDSAMQNIVSGPMATGSAVISDAEIIRKIVEQNRKTIAFDMECYGMYRAAQTASSPRPLYVCLKSVSDFGDETKSDDVQMECSRNSAMVLRYFVEKHSFSLFDVK